MRPLLAQPWPARRWQSHVPIATFGYALFGKQRNLRDAAVADYCRTKEAHHLGQVTLYADVAAAYVQFRLMQRLAEIARENVTVQQQTVAFAKRRLKAGQVGRLDVVEAIAQMQATAAIVPQFQEQAQLAVHQLQVLTGQAPNRSLQQALGKAAIPSPQATLGVGVPADLVRRRPDIRQAEQDLISANHQVGAAVADFYPQLSLLGTISVDSRNVSSLFQWNSTVFQVGPQVRWGIL